MYSSKFSPMSLRHQETLCLDLNLLYETFYEVLRFCKWALNPITTQEAPYHRSKHNLSRWAILLHNECSKFDKTRLVYGIISILLNLTHMCLFGETYNILFKSLLQIYSWVRLLTVARSAASDRVRWEAEEGTLPPLVLCTQTC